MTPPRRWIRLDTTWDQSGWLDALDGPAAGCWPNLLCWVKQTGVGGRCKAIATPVLARRWRHETGVVDRFLSAAYAHGSVVLEGSDWVIPKWAEYQEPDRTAAERQRRHRADRSRLSPLRRDTVTSRDEGVTEGVGHGVTRHATETLTLTETKKKTPKPSVRDDVFEQAKATYPKRTGGQGWADAEREWHGWVKKGEDPLTMLAGVERYRSYVEHEGNVGTKFVKQAATFFGPGKHWTEEWSVNGNGNRQEARATLPGSAGSVLR